MLKVVRLLERASSATAALALLVMIVVSVSNALGRTWLGWSIPSASEISSQWLLPVIVLLAIPGAQVVTSTGSGSTLVISGPTPEDLSDPTSANHDHGAAPAPGTAQDHACAGRRLRPQKRRISGRFRVTITRR